MSENVTKSCGSCKWWNGCYPEKTKYGICKAPIRMAMSTRISDIRPTLNWEGSNCPAWDERK